MNNSRGSVDEGYLRQKARGAVTEPQSVKSATKVDKSATGGNQCTLKIKGISQKNSISTNHSKDSWKLGQLKEE